MLAQNSYVTGFSAISRNLANVLNRLAGAFDLKMAKSRTVFLYDSGLFVLSWSSYIIFTI